MLWKAVGGKLILLPGAVSALLGFFGFPMIGQFDNPVFWVIVASPLVLWLIGGLLIRAVKLQEKLDIVPHYDASASEAFRHLIMDAEWGIGKDASEDGFITDVEGELRDAARNGRLQVWARTIKTLKGGFKETLVPIPKEKWDFYKFDLPSCMFFGGRHASVSDYTKLPYTNYEDTRISRKQLILNWPKAGYIEKWRDNHYSGRREFYQQHQDNLRRKYGKKDNEHGKVPKP